jgi:transposase
MAWPTARGEAESLFSLPEVAVHLVRLACERPEHFGRSLSQWDCQELAMQLVSEGLVPRISSETVRRILSSHRLKPWQIHYWMTPKAPRDAEFFRRVNELIDLYSRPLADDETVYSVDEKTSLQPRPRLHPTQPAQPGCPNRVEHEYRRAGALNLFGAFDTRTGKVLGRTFERQRQREFIAFLEHLDAQTPPPIRTIHLVCDNVSTHQGKQVQLWLASHPRFQMHFTPVGCSWINQIEQWFSILQRKRFRLVDFASKEYLAQQMDQFIAEWNTDAHPFNWSANSAAKVMAGHPIQEAA